MAVTDIATLLLSIIFLVQGASRGFVNSLAAPFSIIAASSISIIYYKATGNTIVSLLIGLAGPLLLSLLLKLFIKTWARATNTDIKPDFLSRVGGSILTLIWGWVFIIFALILLTVLPPLGEKLTAIHNDVAKSVSYVIARPVEDIYFGTAKQSVTAPASEASGNDAQSLAQDPRFQKILQDPEIQNEINAHDIAKLMANPKMMDLVQQLMSDPATMKRVMTLYKSQAASTTGVETTQNP